MTAKGFDSLGTVLKGILRENNLRAADLARCTGVSKGFISDVLNGKKKPSIAELENWSAAMKLKDADRQRLTLALGYERTPGLGLVFDALADAREKRDRIADEMLAFRQENPEGYKKWYAENIDDIEHNLASVSDTVLGMNARRTIDGRPPLKVDYQPPLRIPVLGRAAAALGASDEHTQADEPPISVRAHWIGIKIDGSSGHPLVWPGQTVLCDPLLPPKIDRIVVVWTEDGPVLKRWAGEKNGAVFLSSINAGIGSMIVQADQLPRKPLVVVGVIFTDSVGK